MQTPKPRPYEWLAWVIDPNTSVHPRCANQALPQFDPSNSARWPSHSNTIIYTIHIRIFLAYVARGPASYDLWSWAYTWCRWQCDSLVHWPYFVTSHRPKYWLNHPSHLLKNGLGSVFKPFIRKTGHLTNCDNLKWPSAENRVEPLPMHGVLAWVIGAVMHHFDLSWGVCIVLKP